ncbi:DUF2207 family protein [Gordonibacter massiliensis (ex Traore et al. 2017)]|uniref:DUF2207 family protein n=1 Tax=Gordonibacter massiliensis (ex Traore et al. 2017) TaxID=1841863 RepID=UPI001C8BE808|nr:DUF2207 domain-containing protein [Gordonibacter massiliensis (ex Traore et al. 2017)]MBX9035371.1 DUF2207 domain-containing protein [Gordonibacter massiliensis (ex Traore et al. 2017)]
MKKVERFYTQRVRRWRFIDRLSLALPLILFLVLLAVCEATGGLCSTALSRGDYGTLAVVIVTMLATSALYSIPLVFVWRAVSGSIRKSTLRNATFDVTEGIDYYREKLTGLSPTAISLLMDLRIEPQKDVAALVLRYAMDGVVAFEGDAVRVVTFEHPSLKPSDTLLLHLLADQAVDRAGLERWEALATQEAVEEGYLAAQGGGGASAQKGCLRGCLGGCLVPFALLMIWGVLAGSLLNFDAMDAFLDAAPVTQDAYEEALYLSSDMAEFGNLGMMLLFALAAIAIFVLPVAALVSMIASSSSTVRVRRTEQGQLAAEQIAGVRNFLHDFTNLSQADRGSLVVWDDFVVYAVVLEENDRIVKEVLSMRGFDYGALMRSTFGFGGR